jgi:hypothetical protein
MANIPLNWNLVQTNGAFVHLTTHKDFGDHFVGKGFHNGQVGDINGTAAGNSLLFTIDWNNGTKGNYSGTIDSDGSVNGFSYDLYHPWSQAHWHSLEQFF